MAGESKTLTIRLIGNAKGAVGAIAETEAATETLGSKMAQLSKSFKGVGRTFTSAGRTISHRVTLPVVAAGVAAMKMATDFDSAMTKVQTQAGASAADVAWLSKRVLDLSGVTQQSPLELANAMYHLKSVGMQNVQAMKALKAATDLASVSGADMEETTNAVAGAWRTGIKGAQSFKGAVATLNAIVGAGNMRMSDLNDAMGTGFLATAKTFGLSLHDVGSALAVMTDEGVPANAAATRLRMSFSLLGAPTAAAEKQLAKIGLTGKDLAKSLRRDGIVGAIGMLREHLKGLSAVDASQILSRAFGGGRSSAAIMTLINNFDVLEQKEKQVTSGMGKFGASVAKQAKGPKAQFALLMSTIEMLAVKIGNKLLPFAVKAAQAFNKFLGWASALPGPIKKMAGVFTLVLAAAGPLLMIIGAIATGLGALFTPVGAIVAVVVALAAIFAVAMAKSKGFRDMIVGLGQKLKAAVWPQIQQIVDIIKSQFIPAFKAILPIVGPIVGFLVKMFGGALIGAISGVIQVIKGVVQVIGGVFQLIADLIHGRWKEAWHDLLQIVTGVFNILIGAFKVWWNGGILAVFKHGIAAVLGFFKGGFLKLVGESKLGVASIGKALMKIIEVMTWPYRKAFSLVLKFVETGWKYIRGDFGKGVSGIKGILRRVIEVVTWPFRTALSTGIRLVSNGISRIIAFFRGAPGRIRSALSRVRGAVFGALRGAGSWLWNSGQAIIRGLVGGIGSMAGAVYNKIHGILSSARRLLPFSPAKEGPFSGKGWTLYSGRSISQGLADGISSRLGQVRRAASGLASAAHPGAVSASLSGFGASGGAAYAGGYLGRSAGGSGVTVHVTVEGNLIGEKDFAKRILPTVRDEFVKIGRRNGGKIFD